MCRIELSYKTVTLRLTLSFVSGYKLRDVSVAFEKTGGVERRPYESKALRVDEIKFSHSEGMVLLMEMKPRLPSISA